MKTFTVIATILIWGGLAAWVWAVCALVVKVFE